MPANGTRAKLGGTSAHPRGGAGTHAATISPVSTKSSAGGSTIQPMLETALAMAPYIGVAVVAAAGYYGFTSLSSNPGAREIEGQARAKEIKAKTKKRQTKASPKKATKDTPKRSNTQTAKPKTPSVAVVRASKPVVIPQSSPSVTLSAEDLAGFETVLSSKEKKSKAHINFDLPALRQTVDSHTGAPQLIQETFNQLINGSIAQGEGVLGAITGKYRTAAERLSPRTKFSVSVSIPQLANWEIHVHCEQDGRTAKGTNPLHYKRAVDRGELGLSVPLTVKQENLLIPPSQDRLAESFTDPRDV